MQLQKNIPSNLIPFKINDKRFKYLGIWISSCYKDPYEENYLPMLESEKGHPLLKLISFTLWED